MLPTAGNWVALARPTFITSHGTALALAQGMDFRRVTVTLAPDVLAEIDRLADEEVRARSYVVERALRKALGLPPAQPRRPGPRCTNCGAETA